MPTLVRDEGFPHDLVLEATGAGVPGTVARLLHAQIRGAAHCTRCAVGARRCALQAAQCWREAAMAHEAAAREALTASRRADKHAHGGRPPTTGWPPASRERP